MTTYAAAFTLESFFSTFLHAYDVALPPEIRDIYERASKELKGFQDFVERLNRRSRKRMSASLQRVTAEILEFTDVATLSEYDGQVEKIDSLMEKLKKAKEEYYYKYSLLQDEEEEEEAAISSPSSEKMVGCRDERTRLKGALVHSFRKSFFYLIYGMAGVGKTTLAREVFEDLDISEWFECRAWVTVGLDREPEEFTEAILAQLIPEGHKMVMGGDEEELTQQLNEILICRRCLIVLDDVWDNHKFEEYWYKIAGVDNENGSRVLFTSRIIHLDYPNEAQQWYLFEKRLMNREESWDLLREKGFDSGSCPPQLEDAGKKISETCDGLPLTIIVIANLLSKAEESLWIEVAAQRKHQLFVDAYDQISKVLYPSYKKLIDELKLCFLYMGVFPLNSEIPRSMLIHLWTAEDIFDPTVKLNEFYYHDLESLKCLEFCSLLMIYKRSSTYFHKLSIQAISICGLHSSWWYFCQREARKINFFHDLESLKCLEFCSLLMIYKRSSTYFHKLSIQAISICGLHSSWWYFCQREARKINFFHVLDCPGDSLEEVTKGQSRLSIHNNVLFARKDVYNSMEKNCASTAQSLLCFGPYHKYQVPLCFGLKFLQRLDALNIRFYDFPLELVELVKLRYLAFTCNGKIPPSISKLQRLEYLIVHPHLSIKPLGAPSYMPMEIWDLKELKHLHVMGSDLPDSGDNSLGKLSTILDVSISSCVVLNRLPNLKKFKIRIEMTPNAENPLCCLDQISNLIYLESLKCIIVNPACKFQVVPQVSSFPVLPSSLKKLSLNGLGYPWKEMREITLLPHLQQLKLYCNAFRGRNWEVEESGFPSLYFLLIEDIDLVKLVAAHGSFRSLQHLSIKHCYKFEEFQFRNFNDVSYIEIVDCNQLVEKCIKKNKLEESLDSRNDTVVHYSWK